MAKIGNKGWGMEAGQWKLRINSIYAKEITRKNTNGGCLRIIILRIFFTQFAGKITIIVRGLYNIFDSKVISLFST